MKYLLFVLFLLNYSLYAQEDVPKKRNPLRLDIGTIIGSQSLNHDDKKGMERDYVTYYISLNERVSEKSELSFALLYRDFDSKKVSGESLFIKYTNYFKYNWEYQIIYTPQNSNFLNKTSEGEIEEIISTSLEAKFLLGYTFINKKYYRFRLLGGGGYQFLTKMKSSIGGVEFKPDYKKEGGAMYELNPVLDIRTKNDITYSIGFSHIKTNLKTDMLKNQNQIFNSINIGVSLKF